MSHTSPCTLVDYSTGTQVEFVVDDHERCCAETDTDHTLQRRQRWHTPPATARCSQKHPLHQITRDTRPQSHHASIAAIRTLAQVQQVWYRDLGRVSVSVCAAGRTSACVSLCVWVGTWLWEGEKKRSETRAPHAFVCDGPLDQKPSRPRRTLKIVARSGAPPFFVIFAVCFLSSLHARASAQHQQPHSPRQTSSRLIRAVSGDLSSSLFIACGVSGPWLDSRRVGLILSRCVCARFYDLQKPQNPPAFLGGAFFCSSDGNSHASSAMSNRIGLHGAALPRWTPRALVHQLLLLSAAAATVRT